MTEREADALLDGYDKVHVIPNDVMGMLRLVYNRQTQVMAKIKSLDDKVSRLIEGMARDEVISPQTAADSLDRLI